MTAVHWRDAIDILGKLIAKPRFGLFSDLDGTLAPIAATPEAAHISPRNRELLVKLTNELPLVALISGRRAANLHKRVDLPNITYIGNHGLERWVDDHVEILPEIKPYLPALQETSKDLEKLIIPGTHVENKEATLSFHYRQAVNPQAFSDKNETRIAQIVDEHGLELFLGKMVFEVRAPLGIDKGHAFAKLVTEHQIGAALFLGDDISDLNALRTAQQLRADGHCDAWGVGVQSDDAPEALAATADFLALGVDDVEGLLDWLLSARKASST